MSPLPSPLTVSPPFDLEMESASAGALAPVAKADDSQGLHDRLVSAGVRIVAEPFDGPFQRTSFADPNGVRSYHSFLSSEEEGCQASI